MEIPLISFSGKGKLKSVRYVCQLVVSDRHAWGRCMDMAHVSLLINDTLLKI